MRFTILFYLLSLASTFVYSQTADSWYQNHTDQMKLQQMQREIEIARIQAQSESIRIQSELLRLQSERMVAERSRNKERTLSEIMGEHQAKKEADEALATAAAATREEERTLDAVKSADAIYLSLAVALPIALGFLIVNKARAAGGRMKYEEKFGVILMIGSLLLGLLALAISENWDPRWDAIQNLMLALKIRIAPESSSFNSPAMIDVYTKHVLLGIVCIGAYGFTTYLDITPAWKKSETPAAAPESHKEA